MSVHILHYCQKLVVLTSNWRHFLFTVFIAARDDRVSSERSFWLRAFWSHSLVSFGDCFTLVTYKISWGVLTTSCRVLALEGELVRCSGEIVVGSNEIVGASTGRVGCSGQVVGSEKLFAASGLAVLILGTQTIKRELTTNFSSLFNRWTCQAFHQACYTTKFEKLVPYWNKIDVELEGVNQNS